MTDTANKVLDWLGERAWIFQSVVGLTWVFLAIAAYGKGEMFAVNLAFYGMLMWAITEGDKQHYLVLLDKTLALCGLAVRELEKEKNKS